MTYANKGFHTGANRDIAVSDGNEWQNGTSSSRRNDPLPTSAQALR